MNNNWSKDELVLALDLYVREPRCKRSNPELMQLANQLGRSTGSLYARLQNFKAVDPEYSGTGLTAGARVCQPIWSAYSKRLSSGENVKEILKELATQESDTWYEIVRRLVMTRWTPGQTFSLAEVYDFEANLETRFPRNGHIREKLRQTLQTLRVAGEIEFLDERGTYSVRQDPVHNLYPDEIDPGLNYFEGAVTRVVVNAYERSAAARTECIRHHGCRCFVCNMSFEERYGRIGEGFIHVHHLNPISSSKGSYVIDPVSELVPVCPNCHAMLHRQNPPLTIEELKAQLKS